MGGANAFVIQAVNEMALRQQAIDELHRRGRARHRARGLPSWTVAEVLVTFVASAVIAVMVAAGGFADIPVMDEACASVTPDVCAPPDVLTFCRESNGQKVCIKEST